MDRWLLKNSKKNDKPDNDDSILPENKRSKSSIIILKKKKRKGDDTLGLKKMSYFYSKKETSNDQTDHSDQEEQENSGFLKTDTNDFLENNEETFEHFGITYREQTNVHNYFVKSEASEVPKFEACRPAHRSLPLLLLERQLKGHLTLAGRVSLLRMALSQIQPSPVVMQAVGLQQLRSRITLLKFDPLGVLLAAASQDGAILIFDFDEFLFKDQRKKPENLILEPVLQFNALREISDLQWNPQNMSEIAICYQFHNAIHIFDLQKIGSTANPIPQTMLEKNSKGIGGNALANAVGTGYSALCYKILQGKAKLIAGGSYGVLRMWEPKQPKNCAWEVQVSANKKDPEGTSLVHPITVLDSYGSNHLLVATAYHELQVWDVSKLSTPSFGKRPSPVLLKRWNVKECIETSDLLTPQLRGIKAVKKTSLQHQFFLQFGCGGFLLFDVQRGNICESARLNCNETGTVSSCWLSQHSVVCQAAFGRTEMAFYDFAGKRCSVPWFQEEGCLKMKSFNLKKTESFNFFLPLKVIEATEGDSKIILDKDPSKYLHPTLLCKSNQIKILNESYNIKKVCGNTIFVDPAAMFSTSQGVDVKHKPIMLLGNFTAPRNCCKKVTATSLPTNTSGNLKGEQNFDNRNELVRNISESINSAITCMEYHKQTCSIICGLDNKQILTYKITPPSKSHS